MRRRKATPGRHLLKDGTEPEKYIQKRILDWLKATGLIYWRQNSGTVFVGKRVVKLGEEGLPDIIIVVPPGGRILGLEVKSANGKIRPAQVQFRDSLRENGGYYFVVRSLADAQDAVAVALGEERWKQLLIYRAEHTPSTRSKRRVSSQKSVDSMTLMPNQLAEVAGRSLSEAKTASESRSAALSQSVTISSWPVKSSLKQ